MKPLRMPAYLQLLPTLPDLSKKCMKPIGLPTSGPRLIENDGLRLVPLDPLLSFTQGSQRKLPPKMQEQLSLSIPDVRDIVVIAMMTVTLRAFRNCLTTLRPKHIIDLRPLPFFNLEERRFDRSRAFEFFNEIGAAYHDLAKLDLLEIKSSQDAQLNPARLVPLLPQRMMGGKQLVGPLVVLLANATMADDYAVMMPDLLPESGLCRWRTSRL